MPRDGRNARSSSRFESFLSLVSLSLSSRFSAAEEGGHCGFEDAALTKREKSVNSGLSRGVRGESFHRKKNRKRRESVSEGKGNWEKKTAASSSSSSKIERAKKRRRKNAPHFLSLSPRFRISRSALPLHPARRALRAPIRRLSRKREQALNARKRPRSLRQFFFFEKLHRPSISFLFDLLPPSSSSSYDLLHLHALFPKRWPTSPRSRGHRQRPTAARSPRSSSSTPTAAAPSAAVAGRPGRASTSASLSASTAPVSCFSISFSLLFSLPLSFLSLWPFGSFSHSSSLPIHIDKNKKTK